MRFYQFPPRFTAKLIAPAFGLILASLSFGAAAQDRVALNQESHVNSSLLSAAIGAIIQDQCQTISPRLWLAIWKAKSLQRYALNLGYSRQEIDDFVNSKVEKRRMRRAANSYLRANGVVKDVEETYCAVGRAEIAKGTLTGKLLRGS